MEITVILKKLAYSRILPAVNIKGKRDLLEDKWLDKNPNLYDIENISQSEEGIDFSLIVPLYNSSKYIDDLLEAASKNMTIDLDEEIVDAEVERMYKEFTNRLKMQGIDEELYFAYAKVTKEKVKEDMKKEAETRVKYRYLLEAIVKAEKIEISEKDAKAELKKMAEDYKMTEEDLLKEFNNSLEVLKYDLAMRKAIEVLKENN